MATVTPAGSGGGATTDEEHGGAKHTEPDMTPVQRFGEAIADRVERWMPSPFLFAVLLTYAAGIAAFIFEGSGPVEVAQAWYGGFWSLLTFAMQMVLILVTANVVAYHPRVRGVIDRLVMLPKTGRQAVLVVGIGSMITGWISWGLGLIFGAILAREMGKRCERQRMAAHYPLIGRRRLHGNEPDVGLGPFPVRRPASGHARQHLHGAGHHRPRHPGHRMGLSRLSGDVDGAQHGVRLPDAVSAVSRRTITAGASRATSGSAKTRRRERRPSR